MWSMKKGQHNTIVAHILDGVEHSVAFNVYLCLCAFPSSLINVVNIPCKDYIGWWILDGAIRRQRYFISGLYL